ncbi:hypothetical protein BGZ74_006819 [Mortierella antarctica]|nr:hypothetical protein BGZ74_006819 [Mortierella antarctica]
MPIAETVNQGLHGAASFGQGALNKGAGFFHDFRDFVTKGTAFDLAVAFIISTALTAVIKSFVDDLITPLIGLASNRNLDEMFLILRCGKQGPCSYSTRGIAQADGAVTWNWGRFLNTVIYLVLVGLFLFVLVKIYYALRRKAFIRDRPCPYCGKEVNGAAVRCAFCTSWFDQDARRKLDGDFAIGSAPSMSTTTLGTSNGLLKEKESIEVLKDGRSAGVQQSMMNIQPGNVTISGLGKGEVDNVDHPRGVNPNGKATSGSR